MYSYSHDESLEEVLEELGLVLSSKEDELDVFYLIAFNDNSISILDMLVTYLQNVFFPCMPPIAFSKYVSTTRGDDALIAVAIYARHHICTLVELIPEIKEFYYEHVEKGFFK